MAGLLQALGGETGETRFVGGCVRDTLLGMDVSDIDLATRLSPERVMEALAAHAIKAVPTGIAHGTVTAVIASGPVEVTTLRRDVSTDGRHASVAFTDDWREDAARRDFTINALSADPITDEVHDYFGGLDDLERRLVRFIGDPLQRIAEDHLRILRFFRFHARFGRAAPDEAGLAACTARANDLMALSRERIADELLKLLALPDPAPTLTLMIGQGILKPVLPEIDAAGAAALERLVAAEKAADLEPDAVRRLSALLPADGEVAALVGARLRLSNRIVKRLVTAGGRHEASSPQILAYRIGATEAVDSLLLRGDISGAAGLADWSRPRLLIGGGDLIAMGLKPGPVVARTVQALEREWSAQGFPSDPETQQALARKLVEAAIEGN